MNKKAVAIKPCGQCGSWNIVKEIQQNIHVILCKDCGKKVHGKSLRECGILWNKNQENQ